VLPEWNVPEWNVPEWNVPEWNVPEWNVPEWNVPEWNVPEWNVPEWNVPEWRVPQWNVPANAKVMGQMFQPEWVRLSAELYLGARCLVQVWILMRGLFRSCCRGVGLRGRDIVFVGWRGPEGVDGVEDSLHLQRGSLQVITPFPGYGADFFVDEQYSDQNGQQPGKSEKEIQYFQQKTPQRLTWTIFGRRNLRWRLLAGNHLMSRRHIVCRMSFSAVSADDCCRCGFFRLAIVHGPCRNLAFFVWLMRCFCCRFGWFSWWSFGPFSAVR